MALTKLGANVANVQALGDKPTESATQVKVIFDKAGVDIKAFLNDTLTVEADETFATKDEVADIYAGGIADGSIADSKLSNTAGQIKSVVAGHLADYTNPHATTAGQVGAIPTSEKGAVNGVAELWVDGRIKEDQGDGTWVKIAEQALTSATAQINFSSIASGYKKFKMMIDCIGSTIDLRALYLRFNNDASANYYNGNASASSVSLGNTLTGNDNPAYSFCIVGISNHSTSKWKMVMVDAVYPSNSTTAASFVGKSMWKNVTSEINTISLLASAGSIGIDSKFTLWGCK